MDMDGHQGEKSDRLYRNTARELLRKWLSLDEAALRSASIFLGQNVIEAAAEATARLSRHEHLADPGPVLADILQALSKPGEAQAERKFRWFRRPAVSSASPPAIEAIVERLAEQRDAVEQALLKLRSDRTRLADADASLNDFGRLLETLSKTVKAGAREIAVENSGRSSILLEVAMPGLLERQRDQLTQSAVTRQALISLDMLIVTHEQLASAILRARTATIAAIRTAKIAQEAVRSRNDLTRDVDQLNHAISASEASTATGDGARRALDDAVRQARAALAAAIDLTYPQQNRDR